MKKQFLCLIVLGIALTGTAQIPFQKTENLLDISKRGQPSSALYTGTPFVKIERTVGAPAPEQKSGWMDEEKKRLFGTTQITDSHLIRQPIVSSPAPQPIQTIEEISYQTPTGIQTSAVNVPHTTDFITFIQVINENTLSVEEVIQTMNPKSSLFSRILPAPTGQSFSTDSFKLVQAKMNNKPFDVQVTVEPTQIKIEHEGYISAGVQSFYLKYIIQSGVSIQNGHGVLDYQITGFYWPLPIHRFAAFVSFPSKTTLFDKNILFGSNEIIIRDSFTEQTDSNGNTIFRLNNPLPAFAPVKLYETFKSPYFKGVISNENFDQFFNKHVGWFVVLLIIGAILFYFGLSIILFKLKKPEQDVIKFIQSFKPTTLAYLRYGRLTERYLSQYNRFNKNHSKLYHFSKTKIWQYGGKYLIQTGLYLGLSGKYWITVFLMVVGMIYLTNEQKIHLTLLQKSVIFLISGILTIVFYHFWGKTNLLKEVRRYRQKVIQEKTFCGFNEQSAMNLFTRHYPRLLAIGAAQEWIETAEKVCPQIKELPFIKSE